MEIRWKQRFTNFQSALKQLNDGVKEYKNRKINNLEKQGIIKAFEFTHELAWNVMKDYFEFQGNFNLRGSRDSVREAFSNSLISDGKVWMKMIETRNLTAHTYDRDTADEVISLVVNHFVIEFDNFENTMITIANETD